MSIVRKGNKEVLRILKDNKMVASALGNWEENVTDVTGLIYSLSPLLLPQTVNWDGSKWEFWSGSYP